MKFKIPFIAILLLILYNPCQGQISRIEFQIRNLQDDYVYFGAYYGQNRYLIDSIYVKNNQFVLPEEETIDDGLYFIQSKNLNLDFIIVQNEPVVTMQIDAEEGRSSLVIIGSLENLIYSDFILEMDRLASESRMLYETYNSAAVQDSIQLFSDFDKIRKEEYAFRQRIYKTYPDLLATAIIKITDPGEGIEHEASESKEQLLQKQYWHTRKNYFELINLSDERLLRTPTLTGKVIRYFETLVPQYHDSISAEVDLFLDQIKDDICYDYWLKKMFDFYNKSNKMGMEGVMVHIAEKYMINNPRVEGEVATQLARLKSEIELLKPTLLGRVAPSFSVKDTSMAIVNPLMSKATYLILFFYDPDCEHCREKTDVLKANYSEIVSKSVELVGICVNDNIKQWKEYIAYKGIGNWTNVIDPEYASDFREKYNLRAVPKIFILDHKRIIIGKDLDATQVTSFLKKL